MKITVTTGASEGPTLLAAFDAALTEAGVADYNLIYLSSIIPQNSMIETARYVAPPSEYGHRLYVVMARRNEQSVGRQAWAGLGWVQEKDSRRGLFVELVGENKVEVKEAIEATLRSMMKSRGRQYGDIQSQLMGITCYGKPVCALVIAVYKSEGWE
jgi:arginine decarboxylase